MAMDSEQVALRARQLYESKYCCAESVLLALVESRGIPSGLVPRIATGFCGGVSRTSGMCGAATGAIMGIGIVTGRSGPEESAERTYALVREFLRSFQERFGSDNCTELMGCDLGTAEGRAYAGEHNLRVRCAEFVGAAAALAHRLAGNSGTVEK